MYIELARTVAGVDYWYPLSQQEANVLVAGSDGYLQTQGINVTFTPKTANAESFLMIAPLNGADKIRISSREIGVPATPGTLAVYGGFQNRCTLPQPATDSKAYEVASNSLRQQEVNPLSEQAITEQLLRTTGQASGTYYYPSSAGAAMLGYAHLSIDFQLYAIDAGDSLTLTVEATDDDVSPYWHDITRAGYLVNNPAAGGAASYVAAGAGVTTAGILDFDFLNSKLYRVKLVVVDADADADAIIYSRKRAL